MRATDTASDTARIRFSLVINYPTVIQTVFEEIEELMRLLRLSDLRFQFPTVSATARSNCSVAAVVVVTLTWIGWNTHGKPSGAYRGAVIPKMSDLLAQTDTASNEAGPGGPGAISADCGPRIEGKLALRMKQALLQDAHARLCTVPDYFATFIRQERVGRQLLDRESMELKVRHAPFSVYMKWHEGSDVGREVLFIEGKNDGRLLVSPGNVLPTVKLEPSGDLAMRESRHPVTEAGVLKLVDKILGYCERDLKLDEGVQCQFLAEQKFDSRLCHVIRTDYGCAEVDSEYRCSVMFLDKETLIPLCIKNYGWPDRCGAPSSSGEQLTDATLVEFYAFTGLRYHARLSEGEFDHANATYRFHR